MQHTATHHNAAQYGTSRHITVEHVNTSQHNTMQYVRVVACDGCSVAPTQRITTLHVTLQHIRLWAATRDAAQHNTAQHATTQIRNIITQYKNEIQRDTVRYDGGGGMCQSFCCIIATQHDTAH